MSAGDTAVEPPELEVPTVRERLISAFEGIDRWGQDGPAAMQAILDAVDRETVPAVESVDDLANVSNQNIPYVVKGANQAIEELDDQQIPLGSDLKNLSDMVGGIEQSIDSRKLDAVDAVSSISNPSAGDTYYVTNLDTTVEVTDSGQYRIKGKGIVDTESDLPNPDLFVAESKIEVLDTGKVMEVQA